MDELTLANFLRPHRVNIFDGLTTMTERRDKARHAIKTKGLAYQLVEKKTVAEWFVRAYGESL